MCWSSADTGVPESFGQRCGFRPALWRSKRTYRVKTDASVAMFCDPVFAEACTGKGLNRTDYRRFFQVMKRGAVNDSSECRKEITQNSSERNEKLNFSL